MGGCANYVGSEKTVFKSGIWKILDIIKAIQKENADLKKNSDMSATLEDAMDEIEKCGGKKTMSKGV